MKNAMRPFFPTCKNSLVLLLSSCIGIACSDQPKVIQATAATEPQGTEIKSAAIPSGHVPFNEEPMTSALHSVTIKEVLPTSKYVYALVQENDQEYWLATNKVELQIGAKYYYKNGLLKTNFRSKEHDRTFDKLYLVSSLIPQDHGQSASRKTVDEPQRTTQNRVTNEGSVSIAEIVKNPKKYSGQTLQVSGECSKINANIMGRHWIHLKDGSQDEYDFVVTSKTQIPVGHVVTFTGTITLQKDFGSGYYYDILMEDAVVQ